MRIQVLSDLHLEFGGSGVPRLAPGAEVVVMAGDFAPAKRRSARLAARAWKDAAHILYVPAAAVTIGHVRFIGATLWTDFRLESLPSRLGGRDRLTRFGGAARELDAHHAIGQGLNDFAGAIRGASWKSFTTWEAAHRHAADRAFIEAELAQAEKDGLETVVVTHHAPSPRSIHPRFAGDECNPGFASNLEAMIQRFQPALWVHGHVHNAVDEQLGRTRILANPRGYDRAEAMDFVPDLIVEL